MTDTARASLVERVAMALARAAYSTGGMERITDPYTPDADYWDSQAIAAIDIALEEAAKVAEGFPARTHGNMATAPYAAVEQAMDEIAAAIRALKSHP